ncbi:AAA family ATPase [Collinsella aerofaciens]|uniref:AAA family ATPase n=1 Tax=Collinsella aerofaciens TaxID=74426 RepID=UPI001D027EC1|nr:AAA family ATPase [Collinsella aerofaciens]MCB5366922.1 AAA family ATPase [Collinsella aerofaciens]
MEWTKLRIQNFLSIKEAELKIDNQGLVLIEGKNLTSNKFKSNGSGKSSLLDSIVYAIYDTTSKGLRADDIVNNKVGKNTAVILEGRKGEDVYRIERYRKHSKYKNKVKLFLNDKEITGKSASETNKMIEKIVGIDYNTFINSIMFSQGNGAGRFALATDKEKKEILEGLVNLEIYAEAQNIAKDRVKAKEAEIAEKQREGERLKWELEQVDQLEQQDKRNYENTKELIVKEQNKLKTTIDTMTTFAKENYPQKEAFLNEIEELKKKRDEFHNIDITSYMEAMNKASQELRDCKNLVEKLNKDKTDLVNKYKQVQMSTNCPMCGNPLDPVHREQEMNSLKEQLKEVLIQLKLAEPKQAEAEEAFQKAQSEYLEKKAIYDNTNSQFRQIVNLIQEKERQVQQYEHTLQAYKNEVERIKGTLETLRKIPEPKPRDEEREKIKAKIKVQKEELLALEKEKKQLEDVVKVFSNSGVKSHVLDLITPFLNERANKYISVLSGPDMEIKFSTQTRNKDGSVSDKFDLQILNRAGGDKYTAQSEGEKKRADLSISLAIQDLVLQKANSSTNFVIYDEVFDALDEVGCENVVTLLRERLKEVGTIFVITHSEHLKPLFEKSITVVKDKDGTSTIQEGQVND